MRHRWQAGRARGGAAYVESIAQHRGVNVAARDIPRQRLIEAGRPIEEVLHEGDTHNVPVERLVEAASALRGVWKTSAMGVTEAKKVNVCERVGRNVGRDWGARHPEHVAHARDACDIPPVDVLVERGLAWGVVQQVAHVRG